MSSFALAYVLAQLFGARTVGLYQIGFTTVTLLATIAVLSQDVLLVRKIAPLLKEGSFAEATRHFLGARRLVLLLGAALAGFAAILAFPLAEFGLNDGEVAPFILALAPAVLLLPLMRVHNALLRCLGRVKLSQSLEGVFYTSFGILGLLLLWAVSDRIVPIAAPILVTIGLGVSVAMSFGFTREHLREWSQGGASIAPDKKSGAWTAAAPIISHAGHWIILLAIAAQLGADDAGIFRVGVLICMLMQMIKSSFATMAGPYLAQAAKEADQWQIRKVILIAGGIGLAIASPVGVVAVLFPEAVLKLFGEEFESGALALQLLAIGQLFSVAAGPVGAALIMRNRERTVLLVEVIAVGAGLLTATVLLPLWGLAGAAMGLLVADLLRNSINGFLNWSYRPT